MIPAFLYRGRGGRLYFRDTFVPMEFLLKYLAEGQNVTTFLAGFPCVTRVQAESLVRAAEQALVEKYQADEPSF